MNFDAEKIGHRVLPWFTGKARANTTTTIGKSDASMDRGAAIDAVLTLAPWASRWFATSGNKELLGVSVGWSIKPPGCATMEMKFRARTYESAVDMAAQWLKAVTE